MSNIGIDYAARSVYVAALDTDKVLKTSSIHLPKDPNISEKLAFLQSLRNTFADYYNSYAAQRTVYLETPWVNAKVNAFTGVQMAKMSTYIEVILLECGMWPEYVMPATWRKVVYGNGRPDKRKELSRKFVLEKFGFETKHKSDHNIAEAICIAYYGHLRNLQGVEPNISGGFAMPTIGESR